MLLRTLKFVVAYDGTRFVGWQRQAAGESVQGLLEAALAGFEGQPVTVHGAGRTDAGVHALGQVASVTLACSHDVETLRRGVNAQLPEDVRVMSVAEAAPGFHARFSARSKTYRYLLRTGGMASPFERGYVWQIAERLDLERMTLAARALVGTHDFAAFQSSGSRVSSTSRTLTRSVVFERPNATLHEVGGPGVGRLLAYEVQGDGFLRHMVRAIVGTLVEVGRHAREPDSLAVLMQGSTRGEAGATAPAHGLYLVGVDYH